MALPGVRTIRIPLFDVKQRNPRIGFVPKYTSAERRLATHIVLVTF